MERLKALVKAVIQEVKQKHLQLVAAGLAFFFLLSLFPALILLTAIIAYLPVTGGAEVYESFLSLFIPAHGLVILKQTLSTIQPHRSGLLSVGIIGTLWISSKSMKGLISALDIIHEVKDPRSLVRNRFYAFGLACGVGLLMVLGITLTLLGPAIESMLAILTPVQSLWITLWPYIQWFVSATTVFAAIELLYVLGPNMPVRQRRTVPGAILATVSVLALAWGMGFSFAHSGQLKLNIVYGTFAAPVALLIWLNWSAMAILIGAEVNVNFMQHLFPRKISTPSVEHKADAA